ncbi:hypothetical protein CNMCM8714_005949 [Aspergillus fumigatus]|nr:hypothetical protein CNMCM8714_005949 [Aspergillus fumigatus]
MAYNKSYNPDALPAHAEPEQVRTNCRQTDCLPPATDFQQVAQMIGSMQVSSQPQAQRPPRTSSHAPPGGHPQRVPVTNALTCYGKPGGRDFNVT